MKWDRARWCYCIGRWMLGGSIGGSVGGCGGSKWGVLRMESREGAVGGGGGRW